MKALKANTIRTISKRKLFSLLGRFVDVENCPSRNGKGQAPNQFIVRYTNGSIFKSYDSLIGAKIDGQLYLTPFHEYSKTTMRFCGDWCGYNTRERRKGLENGTFVLVV